MASTKLILVTGATGYVGGRLVPRLLAAGYRVRCLVRDPARLQGRAWLDQVELARGDVLQPDSLVAAMRDVGVVYYLVHSLGGGERFFGTRFGLRRATAPTPRNLPAWSESFIWADSAIRRPTCHHTCARVTKRVRRCARQVCR